MKKAISIVLIALMLLGLCGCGGSGKCKVCHGSGYYQKRLVFSAMGLAILITTRTNITTT